VKKKINKYYEIKVVSPDGIVIDERLVITLAEVNRVAKLYVNNKVYRGCWLKKSHIEITDL
jgi:hypothetical protein